MNKSQIKSFSLNGELKITNFLSKKEVLRILKEYDIFTRDINKGSFGKNFNYLNSSKKLTSIHRLEKYKKSYFFKIASKKKIFNTAQNLLGNKCKLYSIQFFFKNSDQNLATPPHQDNAYWCYKNGKGLSFWIPLNKTDKLNGTLFYYRNTHNLDRPHYVSLNTPGSSQKVKIGSRLKKTHYRLKAGDCVAHDSRIIHGSYKNLKENDRRAFIISFITKNSIKDKIKQKKYENRLSKISKKNKKNLGIN